jgi:hypothetical protein
MLARDFIEMQNEMNQYKNETKIMCDKKEQLEKEKAQMADRNKRRVTDLQEELDRLKLENFNMEGII